MSVAIIRYGMGNVKSVANALRELGADPLVTDDPADLAHAEAIVLPGVGAFRKGMEHLERAGFIPALREQVLGAGKPFLGICLGMQLLAEESLEHGRTAGLGWIPGRVVRIEPTDPACRVPHMGWNELAVRRPDGVLFQGFDKTPSFYFVHSYHLAADAPDSVAATCDHGGELTAAVERGNVLGVQFHPEKSQKAGLKLLQNFLNMRGGA